MDKKKFLINVTGGTGYNIGLCHVLNYLNDNFPGEYEFNIISPYYDLFLCCPGATNVYQPQEMRDAIFDARDKDWEIVNIRLYDLDGFIKKQLNYTQAWLQVLHIPEERWPEGEAESKSGTSLKSKFVVYDKYPALKGMVDNVLKAVKDNGFKDFIIVQFTGGQSPLTQVPNGDWSKVPYDYQNEPLKRHYPIEKATEFCKLYHNKHPETAIVNFGLPNEPCPDLPYVVKTVMPYLGWYELAKYAKEIVCIDSSLQHLTAGLVKTTVIWGHSKPENFGYSYNKNIEQSCRTDDLLYFTALGPSGAKVDYIEPADLLREVDECN